MADVHTCNTQWTEQQLREMIDLGMMGHMIKNRRQGFVLIFLDASGESKLVVPRHLVTPFCRLVRSNSTLFAVFCCRYLAYERTQLR